MTKLSEQLSFLEIVVLRVIADSAVASGKPPTIDELYIVNSRGGLVNQWLIDNNVSRIYTLPISSKKRLQDAIAQLRLAQLLLPKGSYVLNEAYAKKFLKKIGADWKKWPESIPIDDGKLLWNAATYIPELM